jgi:hypothetical protein
MDKLGNECGRKKMPIGQLLGAEEFRSRCCSAAHGSYRFGGRTVEPRDPTIVEDPSAGKIRAAQLERVESVHEPLGIFEGEPDERDTIK